MTRLTPNFLLEEFTHSADHPNLVAANTLAARKFLPDITTCAWWAESIRRKFGAPVRIHSGFRFKALNDAVGSQDRSQHMVGQAFDFDVEDLTMRQVLDGICNDPHFRFHQLLIERGCVHFGILVPGQPNGEVGWWAGGQKVIYRAAS